MLNIVHMTVNGKEVELAVDPRESLVETLREKLNLTSVKRGCGVGECGACTVLIDGVAIDACLYLTMWAEGKHILTTEGLKSPTGSCGSVRFLHSRPDHDRSGTGRIRKKIHKGRTPQTDLRPPVPLHRIREHPERDREGRRSRFLIYGLLRVPGPFSQGPGAFLQNLRTLDSRLPSWYDFSVSPLYRGKAISQKRIR